MLIDTHAHIYLPEFDEDRSAVIQNARDIGISTILMPNIDSTTLEALKRTESSYPDICKSMMGLHPCSVGVNYREELELVESELATGKYIAVGEIGTDLYWDKTFWKEQKEAFLIQLGLAQKYELPVAIHCRETLDETIELVKNFKGDISGVFHCFTGSSEQAKRITSLGFYLGLGGVSTFKNSGMDLFLSECELKSIVLETDSPYLAPVPKRGKRNEPSLLHHIALNLAEKKGTPYEVIAERTTENAINLFQLK